MNDNQKGASHDAEQRDWLTLAQEEFHLPFVGAELRDEKIIASLPDSVFNNLRISGDMLLAGRPIEIVRASPPMVHKL